MRVEGKRYNRFGCKSWNRWSNMVSLRTASIRPRLKPNPSYHCSVSSCVGSSDKSAAVDILCLITSTRLRNNVKIARPGYWEGDQPEVTDRSCNNKPSFG